MITVELRNKVDRIWEYFWTAGVTNPMTVMEQFTYLLISKCLTTNNFKRNKMLTLLALS